MQSLSPTSKVLLIDVICFIDKLAPAMNGIDICPGHRKEWHDKEVGDEYQEYSGEYQIVSSESHASSAWSLLCMYFVVFHFNHLTFWFDCSLSLGMSKLEGKFPNFREEILKIYEPGVMVILREKIVKNDKAR